MYQRSLIFTALVAIVGMALPASAVVVTFDFEDEVATAGVSPVGHPGLYGPGQANGNPTLQITEGTAPNQLTATITKDGGQLYDVMDNSGGQEKPLGWGTRSLDSHFMVPSSGNGAFIISFSKPITSIQALVGDYDGHDGGFQDNDNVSLTAFDMLNGIGAMLGMDTDTIPNQTGGSDPIGGPDDFTDRTLSVAAIGIQSVRLQGVGFQGNHSLFWDNIQVEFAGGQDPPTAGAVPEPTAFALCGMALIGLVAAAGWRKRRR